jgi:hypothetical protein
MASHRLIETFESLGLTARLNAVLVIRYVYEPFQAESSTQ